MTANILALTRYDRMGASSRVRFLQYIPHLERAGLSVTVQPLLPREYLTRLYANRTRSPLTVAAAMINRLAAVLSRRSSDVIWLQREVLPFLPFFLEKGLFAGKPVVIDFDDAHHLYYKNLRSKTLRAIYGSKIDALMRYAAAVVVGNETLADHARASGAREVHVIPSAVDVAKFETSQTLPSQFTVGWIGTPVTAKHSLPLVRAPLRRFMAETGSRCVLFGAGEADAQDLDAECLPWTEAGEADFFSRVSVGICPLEDTDWNRGKSGYKIIQYMAAAKPALVSPVGIASDLTTHEVTGFHCRTEGDWYSFLMQLHEDSALCSKLGACARTEALEKYDTAVAAEHLGKVFHAVLGGAA